MSAAPDASPIQRVAGAASAFLFAGAALLGIGYAIVTSGAPPGVSFLYVDHLRDMLEQGDLDRLIDEANVAIQLDADRVSREQLHYALGLAFALKGDDSAARPHLETAIAVRPDDPKPRLLLGELLLGAGEIPAAQAMLRPVLEMPPDGAKAARILALIEFRARRHAAAIPLFERAIASGERPAMLLRAYAQSLFELGRYDEAAEQARRAIALGASAGLDHSFVADALLRAGNDRGAIDALRTGVAAQPDDLVLASRLTWILATHPDATLRDPALALELAERDHARSGDAYSIGMLGVALASANRRDEAIARLDEAILAAEAANDAELAGAYRTPREVIRESGLYLEAPLRN
jgi:tetratricopeptide (TPR) repeat protein